MIQNRYIALRGILLAAVLSAGTLFLPGCAASTPANNASAPAAATNNGTPSLEFKKITPVSIAQVLRTKRNEDAQELLDGFDWFYDEYIDKDLNLESIPSGAVAVTDSSKLDGEWIVTHFRHPYENWQKQILKAELKVNRTGVSYTETWQYVFYDDGTIEDARTAAHDLPYSGTVDTDPLTLDLTEEYFDNILTYFNFYEYNGCIYAIGTYYSDFDEDLGFAAMYKASEKSSPAETTTPTVVERPKTETVKPESTTSTSTQTSETSRPETVDAPSGLEFLEGTWKGGDYYFTIRFLDDGRLNYTKYSVEALGNDTGFGGMNAHYVTNSYCEYKSGNGSVSFSDENGSITIERSGNGLRVSSKKSGEAVVEHAAEPDVFVPLRK